MEQVYGTGVWKMEKIEDEFIAFVYNHMGRTVGLQDLPLKIFSIVYLEPDAISMDDIAKKTGYSLASISNTMKFLENMGQVQRVIRPGTRKVYFRMEKDLIRLNIKKIDVIREIMIIPAKEQLPKLISRYKPIAKNAPYKKKIDIIDDFYRQIMLFEGLLEKWKKDLEKLRTNIRDT
ncbi:winged helix-turn-helix transcriptional regulator [Candidatus Woesearchaeota archaeon]|nr:winged helix-turn-helix transcriptional regulator [Candidatus Woesearchaeota archaeon]